MFICSAVLCCMGVPRLRWVMTTISSTDQYGGPVAVQQSKNVAVPLLGTFQGFRDRTLLCHSSSDSDLPVI